MYYHSTRNGSINLTAAQAIAKGLSEDGGLFVPGELPKLGEKQLKALCAMDYQGRAKFIMSLFLDGFSEEELDCFVTHAYGAQFDSDCAAPLKPLNDNTRVLELWHGPTAAFKDMALQMLPYLMTASMKKTGETRQVCILTATSGDTGKAALEGFRDVPGTKIMVFYPKDGVSEVQALQMTSQEGENVSVFSVYGNFDDAQSGVKAIFSDSDLREELSQKGWFLSSANSINWGRLLPQIVYYVSAYCDMVNSGAVAFGEKINFCVPTGNFGNILAGYYARSMGLPVERLICASNANDVLTDFINTGVYDKNRPFYTTVSPSMDILISSNLERLLFHISDCDDVFVRDCMSDLDRQGKYIVDEEKMERIRGVFACGACDEDSTKNTVRNIWEQYGYLIDTHTAVACSVLKDYRARTGDVAPTVVVSTASPYKFCGAVLEALGGDGSGSGLDLLDALQVKTGTVIPKPLDGLRGRHIRFTDTVEKKEMTAVVKAFIG